MLSTYVKSGNNFVVVDLVAVACGGGTQHTQCVYQHDMTSNIEAVNQAHYQYRNNSGVNRYIKYDRYISPRGYL